MLNTFAYSPFHSVELLSRPTTVVRYPIAAGIYAVQLILLLLTGVAFQGIAYVKVVPGFLCCYLGSVELDLDTAR